MPELLHSAVFGLPPARIGKVREVYDLGDEVLIVATDRISAFDVVMANGIPDKGQVLNQMSAFWFKKLAEIAPHHMISVRDEDIQARCKRPQPELAGRAMIAKKATPLSIECVARGYLSGSLYQEYQSQGGHLHGLGLPNGLTDSDRLADPIFTPATKAEEGHDQNISFDRAADMVGVEVAQTVRDLTLKLYGAAAKHCEAQGIILADTKFEFGLTDSGVIWIDEALTPDSSRFWDAERYEPGKAQPSFDKQFVRDYLQGLEWNKQPPGPMLPSDVVHQTRDKYLDAFQKITGTQLSN